MGREANCECQWGEETAQCKVLLETSELIVRGALRHKISISTLTHVSVRGERLHFRVGADEVALNLGADLARSWAKKMIEPPPALAAKLGISHESKLGLIGEFETDELKAAIAGAGSSDGKDANLLLAVVKTVADLNYVLDSYANYTANPTLWIIYPKGQKKPLAESDVRGTLRHEGFIDTKVASVSATLTALRFIKRT